MKTKDAIKVVNYLADCQLLAIAKDGHDAATKAAESTRVKCFRDSINDAFRNRLNTASVEATQRKYDEAMKGASNGRPN